MSSPATFPQPSARRALRVLLPVGIIAASFFIIPIVAVVMLDLDVDAWIIVVVLLGCGALIVEDQFISPLRQGRKRLRQAQEFYARAEATAGTARTDAACIPTDDAHGAQVLHRLNWLEGRQRHIGKLVAGMGRMRWIDWYDPAMREATTKLGDDVSGLSAINDAVHNAATLLTLAPGWEEAWENECGPLREDLGTFRALSEEAGDAVSAATIDSELGWARVCGARLTALRARLASGSLAPGAALDELDAMAAEIRGRADALARGALAAERPGGKKEGLEYYRKYISTWKLPDDDDRFEYSGTWEDEGADGGAGGGRAGAPSAGSYNPAATIRLNDFSPGIQAARVRWRGLATASQYSSPIERILEAYDGSRDSEKKGKKKS